MPDNQPADDKQTDNKPTEDQVKIANELEMAKWEGDFPEEDLQVKYKKDDDGKDDKSNGSGDKSGDKSDKQEEDAGNDEDVRTAEEETYSEAAPAITIEDPGEYEPADYSFEVTLKDGKTKKVSTIEDADALADDPDNFETPKQLMDFINKQNKMRLNLDKDREKYDEQKTQFDEQTEEENERQETIVNFANEFKYLVDKKLLPPIPKEYLDANWQDPEVAKQPGVKEQTELLDYMVKENKIRAKVGVKPLTSIVDTYNAWQLEKKDTKEDDDRKAAGEQRKAAGSKIAGVSPSAQTPYVPKGIAVGNPHVFKRNEALWDN